MTRTTRSAHAAKAVSVPPPAPPAAKPTYLPTFAEETFIAHCYGTDEEIALFTELIDVTLVGPTDRNALVNLIILIEEIKNRNQLGMDWKCCWRCQRYSHCEINWYRGERKLAKVCCPNCVNYRDCNKIFISQRTGRCQASN